MTAVGRGFLRMAVLLALSLAVYFVDLGGSSIWDANEAFYAETPREMIERGDYVTPTFNYEPRLNKPVLSYWIVAGFYQLFGVAVGVQRLAIAIGAVMLAVAAFLLARAAFPGRLHATGAGIAGLWAAVGVAVSPRHVMFGRRIFVDIYISMFMALTLTCFALAERYPERRRIFLLLMYACVGLGLLTKGPVAAALPALVFGLYLVVHGELRRVRDMMIPSGIAVVSAIVIPWYAAQYVRHGWTYIVAFFVGENVARYTEGLGVNASRPVWFYLPVVVSDAFPLSILIVAAALGWFRDRRDAESHDPSYRIRTLLWLWILGIVAFFSASTAKQDLYIYPIVPAVAALGAVTLVRALAGNRSSARRAAAVSTAVAATLLAAAGALVLYLFGGAGAVYVLRGVMGIAAIALTGGLLSLVLSLRGVVRTAAFALCVTLASINWIFVVRTLPSFEAYKPVPGFARALNARAGPEDVVATLNVALPSLVFYVRRHVEMAYDPAPVRVFLDDERDAFVIMSRDDYAWIDAATDRPTCIIDSQPTFNVKLRDILARQPVPDLVLVTNQCG